MPMRGIGTEALPTCTRSISSSWRPAAQHETRPSRIVLDLDATDDAVHGHQLGRFFHGYYDCYCFLPLYIFCDDHPLLASCVPRTSTRRRGP